MKWLRLWTLVAVVTTWCVGECTRAGNLELNVVDAADSLLPCRVLVKDEQGECVVPPQAVTLQTGTDVWFFSAGHEKLECSAKRVLLRVEHGLEFVRFKEWIDLPVAGAKKTVRLSRWIDMKRKGYLSGENHLHVAASQLAPMLVAEGLDFGSMLSWWRGPDAERGVPPGEGSVRMLEFAGRSVPTSVYDAELEYDWGAVYIQNLSKPLPLVAESGRPNLDYVKYASDAGAFVHYQGGWSREVLLDSLLGYVHSVNVCNNNFSLHRFQPRSVYSNLLEVKGFPSYPDTDVGMMAMNTDTYYRLLNCGLRLAAGAGSATGVKQAPPGYNRAYVRAPSGATIDEFYEHWKQGHNFVTNGPIIILATDSEHRPGDTIELPAAGGEVTVHLEVRSDCPLQTAEIVVNGRVAAAFEPDDLNQVIVSKSFLLSGGSWIAARCVARDELLSEDELKAYARQIFRPAGGAAPSRLRFAHTSPIYVSVGGKGVADASSIAEGMKMLDQFTAFASANAADTYQQTIQSAIEEARAILTGKLQE